MPCSSDDLIGSGIIRINGVPHDIAHEELYSDGARDTKRDRAGQSVAAILHGDHGPIVQLDKLNDILLVEDALGIQVDAKPDSCR